jgi:hypothetical protein
MLDIKVLGPGCANLVSARKLAAQGNCKTIKLISLNG